MVAAHPHLQLGFSLKQPGKHPRLSFSMPKPHGVSALRCSEYRDRLFVSPCKPLPGQRQQSLTTRHCLPGE